MKNTDFMNLSLPEGADKIDIEILNSDFTAIENLLKQHAIIETMTLNGEGVIIGAIGPYIRLQNIDTAQISIDIGKETYTLASDENVIIRETAENIGIITSGNVHITYFVNPKAYADKEFYTKEQVDELLSNVEATIEVDAELSEISENPVQNKVITAELASYATTAEVESKVTEKVAEIVAGAPEDFDTLKEMSDWLKQHENSAATMNSAIQKNAKDIETANENIEKNKTDIATAYTNIQKNVDDITATKNDVAVNQSTLGYGKKNLLKNTRVTGVISNMNLTVNDDKTISASGTATATLSPHLGAIKLKAGVEYCLSGCPSGGSNSTYKLDVFYDGAARHTDYGDGVVFSVGSDKEAQVRLVIYSNQTLDNLVFSPMVRHADITDGTYEPYIDDVNTRIITLEALSDVFYKMKPGGGVRYDSGYVLRVGNQVHINLTATFTENYNAWVGSVIPFPFPVKTPDDVAQYNVKQVQSDGREISLYFNPGYTTFFTGTEIKKGDTVTIPPMILDMYVEKTTTTEGGE